MIDIVREIDAVQREVGSGRLAAGEARTIRLRRTYDAAIDDVWDALTNPERIGRWFLPISGDYRVGGSFQFEGNAGGEIVACERPNRLSGHVGLRRDGRRAPSSEVELRLTPDGDEATVFELEHTAIVPDDAWAQFGPGAVGVGWDQGAARAGAAPRGRLGRRSDRRGSCPRRGARSRPAAARPGAPRACGRRRRGDGRPQRREHERVLRAGARRGLLMAPPVRP